MHDLAIEYRRTCSSNLQWQRQYPSSRPGEGPWTVFYGSTRGGPYAYGYTCDCPAGRHGKKCKHIKQAEQDRCGWGWEAFAGDDPQPNPDNTCPECGEPTSVIKVGV